MRNPAARRDARAVGILFLALLAALGGCASAGKRYEQGVELEQRGRPLDAARRYVEALRKEPGLAEARRRLAESGARAVEELVAESDAHASAGRPWEAAEALLRLDGLVADAAGVGVELPLPADHPSRRRAAFDRAIDGALADAAAPGRSAWSDRVRALERADARLAPSPEQRTRLGRARLGVFRAWSEAEAARGRFREAYDVAERGLRGAPVGVQEAMRLAELQAEVLRRGTVRVAVLPVVVDDETRRRLSEDLFPEIDDRLAERHLREAPPFVEVTDPTRVAREARREGFARRLPTEREAARLGRTVGAELVVVAEVDSLRVEESQVRETRRPIRTRDGVDTAYVVREGRREAWARVTLTLVDARDGRVVDRATSTASRSARFRRGVYAGDPRALSLPRDDRELFAPGADDRASRELAMVLAAELAERVAREVFEAALRRVP